MAGLRWTSAVLLALVVGLFLAAGPAYAHTELVSTDPAEGAVLDDSPGQVRLTFNEPIRLVDGSIQLFDATGRELASTAYSSDATVQVEVPRTLQAGSYVVSWRVIAEDGHPVTGALTFSVGKASDVVVPPDDSSAGGAEPLLSGLQGATYLALFVSAGLAIFLFLVLGSGEPELHIRLLPVAGPAAVLAALGALLQVPLTAIYQQGLGIASLFDFGRWSDAVARDQVVSTALVVSGALLGAEFLRSREALGSLGGFFLVPVGLVLVGHTRSYGPTWLVALSDVLHLVAGAAWVGGLVGLVLVLGQLAPRRGAEVLARFSSVAAGFVGVVAVTGSIMAWRILRSWSTVVDSPFGRLLIVKVAIVLVVVMVAAANRFWLLPRFVRGEGDSELLRRTVRLEAVGLAGVLLLTGFLVEQSPTPDPSAGVRSASTFENPHGRPHPHSR